MSRPMIIHHHGEHRLDSETFDRGEKISVQDTDPRRIPGALGPNLRKSRAGDHAAFLAL